MILHAKYEAVALTVWDKKIFKVFSLGCHGNPSSSPKFKSLKYFESASTKDHFCEVLLKSVIRFQRRRFFK